MMSPEDVVNVYNLVSDHRIQVWLTGGWGIDALLGEHTRSHKDLDILMLVDDVAKLRKLLSQAGYQLKELWSENLWTKDSDGNEVATAFVLRDGDGRELDAHAMRMDVHGNAVPAWEKAEGFIFTPGDLTGIGMVHGYVVKCQSAENQMICHTGYKLPEYQWQDLERLHEKFEVEFPSEIANQRMGNSIG